jgi:hypothetical protein
VEVVASDVLGGQQVDLDGVADDILEAAPGRRP